MGLLFEISRDGETEPMEVDLDLDPAALTLKEVVRLERQIGSKRTRLLLDGDESAVTMEAVQAIVWTKLASHIPDVGIDDFDIPIAAWVDATTRNADVVQLPMETPNGVITVAVGSDSGNG